MRTIFRRCVLVNFAVDVEAMRSVLPRFIEPDVHEGSAYLSVVVAEMEKMRPAFLPAPLGVTYHQIVYRAVVRCGDERGVHFLRSDADSRFMNVLGNALSFFRFHTADISFRDRRGLLELDVTPEDAGPADVHATYTVADACRTLPSTSAFEDLASAQRWLVDLFAAFAYTPGRRLVDVVRIHRSEWDLRVVHDLRAQYGFMGDAGPFGPDAASLDSVFYVEGLDYLWHRRQRVPIPTG
jgi:uncharacterized protein YqjF (DUF2071 family)